MKKFQVGDSVRFMGGVIPEQVRWANADYPNDLIIDSVYVVESVDSHPSFTRVTLESTQGVFNSVHFTRL
jgi:hypothetical protein